MKRIAILGAILLSGASEQSMAACVAGGGVTQVTGAATLATLLGGSLVCGRPGPGYTGSPSDRWQEENFGSLPAGGAVFDYKLGSNPDDPREEVGTWSTGGIFGFTTVTYVYNGGGGTYIYNVFNNGNGTYSFCTSGSEKVVARIQKPNPGSGCGGVYP